MPPEIGGIAEHAGKGGSGHPTLVPWSVWSVGVMESPVQMRTGGRVCDFGNHLLGIFGPFFG